MERRRIRRSVEELACATGGGGARGTGLDHNGRAVLTYEHEQFLHHHANHLVGGDTENDEVVVTVVLPPQMLGGSLAILTKISSYVLLSFIIQCVDTVFWMVYQIN